MINLRERYGDTYRVTFDPAYDPKGVPRAKLDPWAMQLPCQYGTIYPFGGGRLAVEIDYAPKTAAKVAALPGVRLHQDGDDEKTFLFPADLFEQVAALVKPRKRRRLSEEQKARLATSMTAGERAACLAKARERKAGRSVVREAAPDVETDSEAACGSPGRGRKSAATSGGSRNVRAGLATRN